MRPHHSDEELEPRAWSGRCRGAVALAVFSSLFLPLYWLIEPGRIENAVNEQYEQDVANGRVEYQNACAVLPRRQPRRWLGARTRPGHRRPVAGARARQHRGPLPGLRGRHRRPRVHVADDLPRPRRHADAGLQHGGGRRLQRPPAQQAIIAYILSVQTGEVDEIDAQAFVGRSGDDLFGANCARCHGPNAQGYVGPQLLNVFERYGWTPTTRDPRRPARR
jgi:hypothetical protein